MADDRATEIHGFPRPDDYSEQEYLKFIQEYKPVLNRRSHRWVQEGWNDSSLSADGCCDDNKLKRFIRKGIPKELRPKVWMSCTGAEIRMNENPRLFNQLIALSENQPEAVRAIQLDLNRTFPENRYFQSIKGQLNKHQLDMVLRAVAARYPSIGYCQGLNFLAALMLIVLESPENTFWLLDSSLMYLRDTYRPDMLGLKTEIFVLTALLRQKCRSIDTLLAHHDIDLMLTCSKWYVCWYIDVLPIEASVFRLKTVLRIWDCFFHEGPKIFHRVALTLLLYNKQQFERCRNFIEITNVIKAVGSDPRTLDPHTFMKDIFTKPGSLSSKTINKLRRQYAQENNPITV